MTLPELTPIVLDRRHPGPGDDVGVSAGAASGKDGGGSLLPPGVWHHDGVPVRETRLDCMPRHAFERLVAGR